MKARHLITLCSLLLIVSCGSNNGVDGEDYGDIAAGDSGITLTQAEHEVGWGKANCFQCHMSENIHQKDNTGTGINLGAIRQMTTEEGLSSCPVCHGTNGL